MTKRPLPPFENTEDDDVGTSNVFDDDLGLELIETDPSVLGRVEYETPDGRKHTAALLAKTTVGRHTDNDIQLLDPEVSKTHLVIERGPASFTLVDLGSANGTLLNEEPVTRSKLKDGDVIALGHSTLRVFIEQHTPPSNPFDDRPPTMPRLDPERTVVTLIPESFNTQDGAGQSSVFAMPMTNPFAEVTGAGARNEGLEREVERLRVAFEFAGKVGLEADIAALGQQILERVVELLPADTAVIMLRDEAGNLAALSSIVTGARNEVKIPKAIVDRVVATREALLTHDALADVDLRSSHTIVGEQIRAALCVPLLVRDEVYGVIHLSSSSAAGAYDESDLSLLRAIAQPAALAVANARLITQIEHDARTRVELERFLSPALVERVVKRDLSLATQGDAVQATVLFADIRGFTRMSDGTAPQKVVSMLNEYFEAMVEVIFDLGGVLDKFLGDGLMAVWGTPVRSPTDAARAVEAAVTMRQVLENIVNPRRGQRGEEPLFAGYGIATGKVIAGAMGGKRRQDFTVIGDTVNLASRLCSEARGGQAIICDATERAAAPHAQVGFNRLPPKTIKGVAREVQVFELTEEPANR
jgi:adenylate cyclase